MPYRVEAEAILAAWREVDRKLADAFDADAEMLRAEAARLRDEYQRVVAQARQAELPEPPPFPVE